MFDADGVRIRESSTMGVKEAVRTAKEYVIDLFTDEQIEDLGLEEVVYDDLSGVWEITIGFTRPWNRRGIPNLIQSRRSFKKVCVRRADGEVLSVVHRELAHAS